MSIEQITVIGAGTMGHGIAQVAAMAGYHTVLYDVDINAAQSGLDKIKANLAKGVEKGKVDQSVADESVSRMNIADEIQPACASADLVIEAAPEKLELKQSIFASIDQVAPDSCIYASNTSSLSIAKLASSVKRPAQFIGMHFFNPVHIMALLEIVVADSTSEETLAACKAVGEAIGKTPIVVRDFPGFASSRLGVALGLEAIRMVEQGVASAEDIDKAMELGYRHPMGPLKLSDLVGLDVRLGIAEYLHEELKSEVFKAPQLMRDMVEQGKLGKKSGQGFYKWD